jgi:hypothetical protein
MHQCAINVEVNARSFPIDAVSVSRANQVTWQIYIGLLSAIIINAGFEWP